MILNKSHLRPNSDKTPYELWYGRLAIVKHFKVFGIKFYIKMNDKNIGKFDARVDEVFFLYSHNSKRYSCYNINTKRIINCIDVKVDEHIDFEDNQLVNIMRRMRSHF